MDVTSNNSNKTPKAQQKHEDTTAQNIGQKWNNKHCMYNFYNWHSTNRNTMWVISMFSHSDHCSPTAFWWISFEICEYFLCCVQNVTARVKFVSNELIDYHGIMRTIDSQGVSVRYSWNLVKNCSRILYVLTERILFKVMTRMSNEDRNSEIRGYPQYLPVKTGFIGL